MYDFVSVRLLLGRAYAVADEDDVTVDGDVILGPLGPGDEVVAVAGRRGVAALAQREGGLRRHPHERHRLEVGAARTSGLEPEGLERRRNVLGREPSAACRRGATLEQVVRQVLDVRVDRPRVDGRQGRLARGAALRGRMPGEREGEGEAEGERTTTERDHEKPPGRWSNGVEEKPLLRSRQRGGFLGCSWAPGGGPSAKLPQPDRPAGGG